MLALAPQTRVRSDAVIQRAAIDAIASLQRPRYTHEFRLQCILRRSNNGVPMTTKVDERNMRRQIPIGQLARFAGITASCVLQDLAAPFPSTVVSIHFRIKSAL